MVGQEGHLTVVHHGPAGLSSTGSQSGAPEGQFLFPQGLEGGTSEVPLLRGSSEEQESSHTCRMGVTRGRGVGVRTSQRAL